MKHPLITFLFLLFAASSGALSYWTGASSNDWHTAANWTAGVPNATIHAMIPAVANNRYPVINTTDAVCQRLSLLANASLTVGTADLNVAEYALIWGQVVMNSATDLVTGQSLQWLEGATVNVSNPNAEIYCGGGMSFAAGSNVQFSTGYVEFSSTAGNDNWIKNNSASTVLPNVRSRNSSGGIFYIHGDTTQDIVIDGNFWNYANCSFRCEFNVNLSVGGNFKDYNSSAGSGVFLMNGTVVMNGSNQLLEPNSQTMLNNLSCSQSCTLSLSSDLFLRGTLSINSGIFDPQGNDIRIRGDWANLLGPAAFLETGCAVTFEADWDQYCDHDENFDQLLVNKPAGYFIVNSGTADVSCASYEWIHGGVKVLAGSFSALSLANNFIAGEWILQTGGSIDLSNYGTDRYIDLGGTLTISGGIFNVYGGVIDSYWPFFADASITMSGGTLDFKERGVRVSSNAYSFSSNITGGTIRVAGSFIVNRAGFNPVGNLVVMAGSADCQIGHLAGSSFYSVDINKYSESPAGSLPRFSSDREGNFREITRSQTVTAITNLDINGYFTQRAGYFNAPPQMNVRGDWHKYSTHDSFIEGSGKVVFDGNAHSTIYGEENFNQLELSKNSLAWELRVPTNSVAESESYDWTLGSLSVSGGLFYTHDMVDEVLQGTVNLSAGNISLVQDVAQNLGLRGELNLSGGVLHLWGGIPGAVSAMPSGGDFSLTMSDGLIHRHGNGIGVYDNAYAFSENISGGIIRSDGNFYCARAGFSPAGGTLEFTGTEDAYLTMFAGTLHGLLTNKTEAWVKLMSNVTANGLVTVQSGILDLNASDLLAANGAAIHGVMHIDELASLRVGNLKYLNVEEGGNLQAWGTAADTAVIICDSGYFYLNVRAGGTISARNCVFSAISQYGVYVWPGASIDPNNSFNHCFFNWGQAGGTLLRIDNSDNVVVRDAVFATNPGGGATNVTKTVDAGLVNFINALGVFSGEDFDSDPHNRVFWNAGTDIPDLQILRAEWIPASPSPYLGDVRDLKVTLVNNSIYSLTGQTFYLDLYYHLASPPALQVWGDQFIVLSDLPAGLPVEVTITNVSNFDPDLTGTWNSWLQIDTDAEVSESNESNNVYGPFQITWQALPAITDLNISYDPLTEMATLSWSYPLSVSRFRVYSDPNPYGAFSTSIGWSYTTDYTFSPGPSLFFRVCAERLPPLRSTEQSSRTRQ